jgi:putative transposase
MPQSLANLHTHLIFSTKNRAPLIIEPVRPYLHAYLATVLHNLDCPTTIINSVEDHIHFLFNLGRTVSIAEVVKKIKTSSSQWMKGQPQVTPTFSWQSGYGAFAVSESMTAAVHQYIANQREHHRTKTFQEEYRAFLKTNGISLDERYLWD